MKHLTMSGRRVPCRICGNDAKYIYDIDGHRVTVCGHCFPWLFSFNRNTTESIEEHNGMSAFSIPRIVGNNIQWTIHTTHNEYREFLLDKDGNMYQVDYYDVFHPYRVYPQKTDSLDDIIEKTMEYHKETLRRLAE